MQLYFPDARGQEARRSFSLAAPVRGAGLAGRWELAISLLPEGEASRFLQAVPLGAQIEGAGPFGRFHLMPGDAPARYLLVATGTGVAPFRAMLPELRRRCLQQAAPVILLCGARDRETLLYRDEFRHVAASLPGFTYRGCLSRARPSSAETDLHPGRVQRALRELEPTAGDLALLCGNPAMVDECTGLLRDAGLPLRAIRRERYIASG